MLEQDQKHDLAALDAAIARVEAELAKDGLPADVREQLNEELSIYQDMRREISQRDDTV